MRAPCRLPAPLVVRIHKSAQKLLTPLYRCRYCAQRMQSGMISVSVNEEDGVYESDLMVSPFSVRSWCAYAASKTNERARLPLYERALAVLPGSYKLWRAYLGDSLKLVRDR